ncbi:MAG: alpha/beta hydrolase [Pseudomonadota bacterium]
MAQGESASGLKSAEAPNAETGAARFDAEIRAFIAESGLDFPQDAGARPIAEQRAFYDAMCRRFAAPRPDRAAVEDTSIAGPAGAVPIRRYQPEEQTARAPETPQILYLHGGGWHLGGLDSHDDVCAEMAAETGMPVTAVGYRLAPEHAHPAAYEDAQAAAEALLGEDRPLIIAGDSVGGCLAAALLIAFRRGGGAQAALRGALLIYPSLTGGAQSLPAYREHAAAPLFTAADNTANTARYAGPGADAAALAASDPRFAPLIAPDLSGCAPCHALAVEVDPLRDDAAAFAARLSAAGARASASTHAGLPHGCLRARRTSLKARMFFEAALSALRHLRDM